MCVCPWEVVRPKTNIGSAGKGEQKYGLKRGGKPARKNPSSRAFFAGLRLVGSKADKVGRRPGLCMFLLEPVSGETASSLPQLRGKKRVGLVSFRGTPFAQVRSGCVSLHSRVVTICPFASHIPLRTPDQAGHVLCRRFEDRLK